MEVDLIDWLNRELRERGWSQRELARRAGVSGATISQVLSMQQRPTWEFCASVARALRVPVDDLFVLAGLKRPPAEPIREEQEVLELLRSLPATARSVIITMLRAMVGYERAAVNEGRVFYGLEDDPLLLELVEEFRQLPDEWKEEAIAQLGVFRRLATLPAARMVGDEE